MTNPPSTQALTLVACAAPLAERAPDIARTFTASGWKVRVVTTPSASDWVAAEDVEAVSGHAPTSVQRLPSDPRQDAFSGSAVLVAPLTFNTMNKWALGIADNYAVGILCEAVALGRPVVAVPVIGRRFWGHPATATSMERLLGCGVTMVDLVGDRGTIGPLASGSGPSLAAAFDPTILLQRFA